MPQRFVLTFALLGMCLAGTAGAQAPGGGIPRATFLTVMDGEFRKMDADRNGQVTRPEIEAFQRTAAVAQAAQRNRALFAQLDTDRNGQISPAEFSRVTQAEPVNAMPLISMYDSNKDGKVSQIEYRTIKLARFDRVDADKDGTVSVAEQRAAGLVK